jgi:DNA-binding beta-propeller fold protein YncE
MAIFTPGAPVETTDPFIPVEALPPGGHTFRLVVVDEAGNESLPAFARLEVTRKDGLVDPKVTTVQKLASPADADHDAFGKELWVSANGPVSAANAAAFAIAISLPEGEVIATVPIPARAGDIAVSRNPDRRVALVANAGARSVTLVSIADRKVEFVFRLKDDADGVAVTPDGKVGVVAVPSTGQVIVLDLGEHAVLAEIDVGRSPSKVKIAQQGRIAFVNCVGDGNIAGIDLRRFTIVGRFLAGGSEISAPVDFTVTAAGFPAWTANAGSRNGNGSASAALSATRVNDIPLKFRPASVAADEEGKRGYLVGPEADALAFTEADAQEAKTLGMPANAGGYRSLAATRDAAFLAVVHPEKESASFYLGPEPRLRAVLRGLKAPARVIATDDGEFFCVLDPAGNTLSLVEIAGLS